MVPPCIWFVLPIFHEWNAVQLNSHVPTTCYGCQLCYCPNYVQLCCFGHAVRSGRSTYHWSDGLGSCRQVFEKAAALLQDDTVARLPPTSTSFMVNSQVHSIHRPFLFKNVLLPWFLGKEVLQIIPKRQRLRSWVRWDCCGLLWSRHGFNIRKQCIDPCDALLNPCCVGQEWLKDFGHDDFRLAMHFSTLIKKNVHSYAGLLLGHIGSTPSIAKVSQDPWKSHRFCGICCQVSRLDSPTDAGLARLWLRVAAFVSRKSWYVLVVWGMQLLAELWRGSLSFLVDRSILAWGRFMGCGSEHAWPSRKNQCSHEDQHAVDRAYICIYGHACCDLIVFSIQAHVL